MQQFAQEAKNTEKKQLTNLNFCITPNICLI